MIRRLQKARKATLIRDREFGEAFKYGSKGKEKDAESFGLKEDECWKLDSWENCRYSVKGTWTWKFDW